MKAYIFTGGEIFHQYITERPESEDMVICADSGYKNAMAMGVHANILVGDFDSLKDVPGDADEIVRVPAEKDETDTQLAVEIALQRGADEIVIVGSTSGRFDHALSMMCILEDLYSKRINAYIVNGQNRIRYIKNSGHIVLRSQNYKYFSLLASDETVKGVSVEGAKYPLKNKIIKRNVQFAVSNEILKNCALVTVKKGGLYVVESRDI
jgi:thiamine pyrophosphokinase